MLLRWYNRKLAQRPILTQAVTTAILFATGDIIAQQAVEKKGVKGHEWARTGRMFAYGGVIFGPSAANWFRILATRVNFASPTATTLARVTVDQSLFAPTFIGVFLTSMATMEGTSPREKLSQAYFPALKANYLLWPAVQLINFRFVPLQHRLMFVNVIAIGWNCYLSWLNGQSSRGGNDKAEQVEEKVKEAEEKIVGVIEKR